MQFALGLRLELCLCANVQRAREKYNYPATALLTQGQGHADKPQPVSCSALTVRGAVLTPSQMGSHPEQSLLLPFHPVQLFPSFAFLKIYLSRLKNALKAARFAALRKRQMKNSRRTVLLWSRQPLRLWRFQRCRNFPLKWAY